MLYLDTTQKQEQTLHSVLEIDLESDDFAILNKCSIQFQITRGDLNRSLQRANHKQCVMADLPRS